MLNSAIYTGRVFHQRYAQREHQLDYSTFYFLLDLDEIESLEKISRLFGARRRAWFCFNEQNYGLKAPRSSKGPAQKADLRRQYESLLAHKNLTSESWRFQILTMPSILGYVFNPISLVYCKNAQGELRAMIYEVNNTFDERIHYVLPVNDETPRINHQCDKAMFVSPFFDMRGRYEFDVGYPQQQLNFKIDYFAEDELSLRASFAGKRLQFSAANLRKLAATKSNTSLKVTAGIHWEAVKLWVKGLPIVNHVPLVNQGEDLGVMQSNRDTLTLTSNNNECPRSLNPGSQAPVEPK